MKYLKNVYYCSDSFTRSWYGLCNHVARTASVLLLLLTIGVGQMWGSKRVFIDVSWNTDYASKMMVHFWGGTNDSFVWASKYSSDWNYIYYADIDDDATNWQVCRGDALDGTKYNYQYGVTYGDAPHYNMYKVTEWNNSGTASQVIGMVTGGYMYFDNSQTNWSDSYRYFVIGHDSHYNTIGGNTSSNYIANTKLWYFNVQSELWPDARYYAFLSHSGAYPSADKAWLDIDTYGSNKTSQYTSSYSLNDGSIYLCVPSSGTGKPTFTIDYQSALESMNSTQTIQYALSTDNGSSYDVMSSGSTPGTISISAYKFANGTYGSVSNTSNSQSITGNTTGTYSISVPAAYTGETTLSAYAATGYTFVGWKIGTTETTASSPCYPTEATTYTARFNANQYSITYTSPTNGSYTIKAGDASAVSTNVSSVNYATTITLAATPVNGCYAFDSWTVTGATSGETIAVTNNQFSMPDEDVTVTASFVQVNLAKNKTSYAGWSRTVTEANAGEVPSKALDGNLSSYHIHWNIGDNFATKGWWGVDLGDNYVLSDIKIYWQDVDDGGRAPRSYEIQAAIFEPSDFSNDASMSDATHWRTIKTISSVTQNTGSTANVISFTLGEYVTARYLRLVNKDTNHKVLSLAEFEVFGVNTEECFAANTPTATFAGIEDGQIKLNLSATNTNSEALTNFAVLYDGVYYDVTASEGVGYLTLPSHRDITVRVYAYDKCMQKSSGYVDVEVGNYVNPLENLAELKTTWVSYTNNNDGEKQANLNDGVLDTKGWCPWNNTGANPWMVVDLGDTYQISKVQTFFKSSSRTSTNYKIYGRQEDPSSDDVRADNTKWIELASKSSSINTGSTESDVNESSVSFTGAIRYVRFESFAEADNDGQNSLNLLEFRVFGSVFKSRDLTGPVISTCEIDESAVNYTSTVLHLVATDAVDGEVFNYEISTDGGSSWTKYSTNPSTRLVTISPLSNGSYTFTVRTYDIVGNYSANSTVNVTIFNVEENLALEKTVVAGYEPGNAGEHSNKLTDGTNDAWTTYSDRPESEEWFYVDLGAYYQLSSIQLVWGEVYSTDYILQVRQSAPDNAAESADDNKWYTAAEVTDATASSTKTTDVDISARYIRFHSLARSGGFLRIHEIRVYGTAFADADTHEPVITTAAASYNDDGKAYLTLIATDEEDGSTKWFYLYNPSTETYSMQQTNGSNQIVIDGLTECENYTFTAQAMDKSAQLSLTSDIAVRVPIISTVNLALRQTVVAGTSEGGFAAANAVDGNDATKWSGNYERADGVNQWLYVDLGEKFDLDSVKICWSSDSSTWPQDYEIQVSNDGAIFAPVAHYTSVSANRANKYTLSNVSAQYVRVWANKAGVTYGMQISELAVHGDCYNDTELPIMLFAETSEEDVYVTAAEIYVGAIHKSIASNALLYHVVYTDNTDGSYSGSRTITAAEITNGRFQLDNLQDGHNYTVNIYAAKTSDIAENRSTNYKTVDFTTKAIGAYTNIYMANSINGWLQVNANPQNWTSSDDPWRFQTTATNGLYKLQHTVSTTEEWTYLLYDRDNRIHTEPSDRKLNVTSGRDFIMTMRGLNEYVSNYHTLYIAGDAVGTDANTCDASHMLTWVDGTTAVWEGAVEEGETFSLIFPDPCAGNANYIRTGVLSFTYDESWQFAKLTFDLETWTCSWTESHFVIYHKDDQDDDPHASKGHVESFAGGTIDGIIEYRMKVRAKDQWHALCLPFTVTAVQVWDEEDKRYYDLIPYYRSEGKYYKGHYIIRKPERKLNLPLENFGNWVDPSYQVGFLPQKDTVYIIQWHEDYYVGRYISFFGASGQTIPTSMSVGDAPTIDKVVNLYGNNAMVSGEVTDAYTLVGDYGGGAWLRNDEVGSAREVLPFECYIRANSGTTTIFNAIRRDMTFIDTPTGWDDVVNAEINRQVRVYSITGVMMEQFSDCSINEAAERVRSAYGEGLYILNTENECIQLLVGGK